METRIFWSLTAAMLLGVGLAFATQEPPPKPPTEADIAAAIADSEIRLQECDAAGGDWNACTLEEMKRTLK